MTIRTYGRSRRAAPVTAAIALAFSAFTSGASFADGDHGRGSVWRTWTARVQEEKLDDYLAYLTKVYKHKLAAWKAAGLITDYRILVADPYGPDDPNIFFMYQYENMAALDAPEELWAKASKDALDKIQDPEARKLINVDYHPWRKYTGYMPTAREVNLE